MRHFFRFFVIVGPLVLSSQIAAAQQSSSDLDACQASDDPKARVEACTRLVNEQARQRALLLTFRALALRGVGDIAAAAADLTEAIGLDESFTPALEARADLLRANKQCDLALADYDAAIKQRSDRATLYLNRALCGLDQDQTDAVLSDLNRVVDLDKENKDGLAVIALRMRAGLDAARSDFDAALKSVDAAAALDPKRASLHVDRGEILRDKGELDKAIQEFDEAIRADDNNASGARLAALVQKARLRVSRGEFDTAFADYDDAIKLDPKRTQLYLDRGRLWVQKGNNERALGDYTEAIKAAPDDTRAYIARGDFHRDQGSFDLAIADYDQAIAKESDNLTGYGNRALARFYAGNFAKAADDFRRVADAQARAYSALLLYISRSREGDARDAKNELTKNAAKLKVGEWPYPIVELYLGKKSLKDTEAQAKTAEQKCEAKFYSAEWHLLKKDKDEASKAWKAAVDNCPKDFVEYRASVEELKRLK